mgnify:CR=1 FL=1
MINFSNILLPGVFATVFVLAGRGPEAARYSYDEGGDPPSGECGIGPQDFDTGGEGVHTHGESTQFVDADKDKREADKKLLENMKRKLGYNSGVTCDICPDGVQCFRKVDLDPETEIADAPEVIPPVQGEHDGGWRIHGIYNGSYTVECKACEVIEPGSM